MVYKVLVTGGAGFIGSYIVDELVSRGHSVRILDNLDPQVHPDQKIPNYLNPKAEFIRGDVRNKKDLEKALENVEVIFHEAALVGIGQSMQKITDYVETNVVGTGNLLELAVNKRDSIRKIIVASSNTIYGEGTYKNPKTGQIVYPELRTESQLSRKVWDIVDENGSPLIQIPTSEDKSQHPSSIYAISKKTQEEMVLSVCKAYGIPGVALRYFNVYGPRQSLSNPYTGVSAIFMSRLKNNQRPIIFEDGNQSRDFTSVHDIAQANILAMESDNANYESFNVGSGEATSINDIANILIKISKKTDLRPEITHNYRGVDIRSCYADISKIRRIGYTPRVSLEEGYKELYEWSKNEEAIDNLEKANEELRKGGLLR